MINYLQNSFPPKWLHSIFFPLKENMVDEPAQNHFQGVSTIVPEPLFLIRYNIECKRNFLLPIYFLLFYLLKREDEESILY